jgi:hypothetical protein
MDEFSAQLPERHPTDASTGGSLETGLLRWLRGGVEFGRAGER